MIDSSDKDEGGMLTATSDSEEANNSTSNQAADWDDVMGGGRDHWEEDDWEQEGAHQPPIDQQQTGNGGQHGTSHVPGVSANLDPIIPTHLNLNPQPAPAIILSPPSQVDGGDGKENIHHWHE
ncbi:hypothetical protein AAF712_014178 [Marasmius tenuissimus]|uniref:Uncharacterized protein n=1 Tax=Marasmius tenuissimus TaxID=585030 RepID=A0ABR2ZD08_9AGAR